MIEMLDGKKVKNVIKLHSNNVNTLVGSYWIGNDGCKARWKQDRKEKQLALFIGSVKIDMDDEGIDKILSKFRLVEVGE